ncbi:MAG TPA: hypothetical protein VK694_06520 [Verrucomicrobiae bacterium]|nr:hypothetical protein [Verrucomicrobiae bacterium]
MSTTLFGEGGVQDYKAAPDFWMVYTPKAGSEAFTNVLHALYYLPENYKLMIMTADVTTDELAPLVECIDLMKRVRFETTTELPAEATPFSFGRALVSDEAQPAKSSVLVTSEATSALSGDYNSGFTVLAQSPPALASAILKIAHATV